MTFKTSKTKKTRHGMKSLKTRRLISILGIVALLGGWSVLFAARSESPVEGGEVFRFAVIGDSGTGNRPQYRVATQIRDRYLRSGLDFILMLGDNIYEHGDRGGYKKKFEEPYQYLISKGVQFYAVLGNHDVRWGNWRHAIKYPLFNMRGNRYYSLSFGKDLLQLFGLDSTTLSKRRSGDSRDPDQEQWFKKELQSSTARWKIAFFHHPLYSSGKRHGGNKNVKKSLEELLREGRVKVVFSGHDHFYERLNQQQGVLYFVNGAAAKLRKGNLLKGSGLTACGNDQERSFLYVELDAQELRFEAVSETGRVFDKGTLSYHLKSGLKLSAKCQTQ